MTACLVTARRLGRLSHRKLPMLTCQESRLKRRGALLEGLESRLFLALPHNLWVDNPSLTAGVPADSKDSSPIY